MDARGNSKVDTSEDFSPGQLRAPSLARLLTLRGRIRRRESTEFVTAKLTQWRRWFSRYVRTGRWSDKRWRTAACSGWATQNIVPYTAKQVSVDAVLKR